MVNEEYLLKVVKKQFMEKMKLLKKASKYKKIGFIKNKNKLQELWDELSKKDKEKLQELSDKDIKKQRNELLEHSQMVKQIALEICSRIGDITEEDITLIECATLLHDVEKVFLKDYGKNHNKKGAEYIKKHGDNFLQSFGNKEKKLIRSMVKWHKGDGYKNKDYNDKEIKMIEIVRIADTISKIYKKPLEKCEDTIKTSISELQNEKLKEVATIVFEERVNSLALAREVISFDE